MRRSWTRSTQTQTAEMDTPAVLERYILRDAYETAREIGRGSYATVVELDYKGLRCVGKKIHKILYEGQEDVHLRRFEEECRMLSQLNHPHIVQFLGIYFDSDSTNVHAPVLVMEFLPMTLAQCLDKYGIMPNEISFSILQDVTLGLRYLHERDVPIIHRDLSANNVLLTSDMSAKISDLGMARIVQPVNSPITMTKTPGTWCYMPPEAMAEKARYNLKVDTFSFGVMMIHVLSGHWPFPDEAVRVNPNNPSELIAVSEFDRRESTVKLINHTHPFIPLIKRCLSNNPSMRPTAFDIYEQVSVVAKDNPPSYANRAIMLETIQIFRKEKKTSRIKIENLRTGLNTILTQFERDTVPSENALLPSQLAEMHRKMSDLKKEIDANDYHKEHEVDTCSKKDVLCKEAPLVTHDQYYDHSVKAEFNENLSTKGLDIFTQGIKFSSTRCTSFDVSIKLPAACTNRVLSFKNDIYIEFNHKYQGPYGIRGAFGGTSTGLLCYHCDTSTWQSLSLPPVKDYSLGHLFGKLLSVGGHKVADVYEFDEASQQWVKSVRIPSMPTARSLATVATWTTAQVSALFVCGGKDDKSKTVADVDIFHGATFQWHTASSLPHPRHNMKHIIIEGTLYLVGGEKGSRKCSVFSVSAPDMIESSLQQKERSTCWQILPDIPSVNCWPATLNSYLLAVEQHNATMYIYCPLGSSWIKFGNLPFPGIKFYLATEALVTLSIDPKELIVIETRLARGPDTNKSLLPMYTSTMHYLPNKVKLTL